jgi:putative ABC transport system permease protein
MKMILKQLWNQRRANAWLFMELMIVFVLLWFTLDVAWNYLRAGSYPKGYDTENVFDVRIERNPILEKDPAVRSHSKEYLLEIYRRIGEYPGVESVCYYAGSKPYTDNSMFQGYSVEEDTAKVYAAKIRYISSSYLDVFQVKLLEGSRTGWDEQQHPSAAFITASLSDSLFHGKAPLGARFYDYYARKYGSEETTYRLSGILPLTKLDDYARYEDFIYVPLDTHILEYAVPYFAIRVRSDLVSGFPDRFMREMKSRLNMGSFYLSEVHSYDEMKQVYDVEQGTTVYLRLAFSVAVFFVFIVFLGVMGTFWFRTRQRRGEIGLRIAVGSSRFGVMWLLFNEGLILLLLASIPALLIAGNIVYADLTINTLTDFSAGRFLITVLATYLLMLLMLFAGCCYPAYQAMHISPAEALREE